MGSYSKRVHKVVKWAIVLAVTTLFGDATCDDAGNFMVGVGIADVTGPSVGIGMMGYAALDQTAAGIHTRLFSRAFVFESDGQFVVYVSADLGMVDQAIKTEVVERLIAKYGSSKFTSQNVLLSGTHTHSGPAGYIQYLLYGITSLGFHRSNFDAICTGVVESIVKAYESRQSGKVFINSGRLEGANANRSPTSYLANPEAERARYTDNVDKDMVLLRIEAADGKPLGSVNWFPVHPTSMNNTNKLVSGDNKGYASMQFEYKMNPNARPGKGDFVAAFGSSNLGDVSPNINGAKCINQDGWPDCHPDSTCGPLHLSAFCIAFGPGKNGDMEESTEIIGSRQFKKAEELFEDTANLKQLFGPVQFIHQFINMTEYEVDVNVTGKVERKRLCKGGLGYGFAAGTTDGPGAFDFKQGDTTGNAFWDFIKDQIVNPSPELEACQAPKPVLLAVGEAYLPYDWSPSIVETQILRVGNLYIIGIPGELTTMAGRRLRERVEEAVKARLPTGSPEPHVVIAGLSNVYSHYIATYEEYQEQRYEAASTLYGPHTLDAYLFHYPNTLTEAMLNIDVNIAPGPTPPNLMNRQISLVPPVVADTVPFLYDFGDVMTPPEPQVKNGDTVSASFIAGHPRNDPMRGGTFFLIEKQIEGSSRWETVRTDADWDTKFRWSRPIPMSGLNEVEITWKIPDDISTGFYRIRHFGYYKPALMATPRPYQGSTGLFQIVPSKNSKPLQHPLWNPNPQPKKNIRTVRQFWSALLARQNVFTKVK